VRSATQLWSRFVGSAALAAVLSTDYKRRMRLLQWCMAGSMYLGAGWVMSNGLEHGWTDRALFRGWVMFVGVGMVASLLAIRTGWTERLRDPGLTTWQLVMGGLAVDWGYLMCGPLRTIALFPFALVLTFGAFSLSWRRIIGVASFSLASLVATILWIDRHPALHGAWPASEPALDRLNLSMMLVLMPAMAVMAARMSSMRRKLRTQRALLSEQLDVAKHLADVDTLTGLPNRRALVDCLERCRLQAASRGPGFVVALLDIDHFKKVNDALGHAAGDELLASLARIARDAMRAQDVVGRWGGEEFLILTQGADVTRVQAMLERLQLRAFELRALNRPITFSVGVSTHRVGEKAMDTVARADAAMYDAKQAGRDRIVVLAD
jgi:diguanylate cyclase (GGDEF)-like protein